MNYELLRNYFTFVNYLFIISMQKEVLKRFLYNDFVVGLYFVQEEKLINFVKYESCKYDIYESPLNFFCIVSVPI